MTRGHRGSLLLRCRALSSPSPCRFIPALRQNDTAGRVLRHLADAGASSVEDIKVEIGVPNKVLAAIRRRLERSGASLALPAVEPAPGGGHVHTSVLRRWDHVVPESPGGRLDDVVVAAVRATVVAPEAQVRRWLPWPVSTAMIECLDHRGPARTHCRGPDRSRLRTPPHHSGPGCAPARRNHRSTGSLSWHAGYRRNNSGLADSRRRGTWHRRGCATSGTCRCQGSIGQPRATRRGWCSRGRVPGDRLGEGPSRTRSRPWGDVGVPGAGIGRLDGRLGFH